MFHFTKNVGAAQRVMRVIAGGMMIAGGILLIQNQPAAYVLLAAGATGLLTGVMGYCPACAMIGVKAPETR